jgi:putative SOS response-associated peptidase YedK
MCSRYTYVRKEARLRLRERIEVFDCVPRADIRITDLGPIVVPEHDGFACHQWRWGWTVPWDKKPLNNAKSETLTTLRTFQPHLSNRCLLLADGFFEKGIRFVQPGLMTFCMAGLWRDEEDGPRYTMLTATPNASVAPHHHRMPFILRPEQYDDWLGEKWREVLDRPDHAPLEKIQQQPELF